MGVFVYLDQDTDATIRTVKDLGLSLCEIYTEDFSPAAERSLQDALQRHGVDVSAVFTMGPGPMAWDFIEAPSLNGLIPAHWRAARIDRLKQASDFARRLGIRAVETHCGFIPENPKDPLYAQLVEATRAVVKHCQVNGQTFLYHAGAESAVALLRIIEDVGLPNQGIGLDTANSILYGTGNPVDALEIYGPHVRTVNAKDGLFPTNPRELGKETPIGQGRVDFARFIQGLRRLRYSGPIIIEREVRGPNYMHEVRTSITYLERLLRRYR